MSRLRFLPKDFQPEKKTLKATPVVDAHHILFEVVPIPVGTNEYDSEKVRNQCNALKEFKVKGKDLFQINECESKLKAGSRLYQTLETYGTSITVEQIIETLKEHDLTLRVNFRRPGIHSTTTCMELSSKTLTSLIGDASDSKNEKTHELRVKAEANVSTPKHGAMYITVVQRGAQHLLQHVDYKIMKAYDDMYHSN